MSTHTLGAIPLSAGLIWVDEFDWRPVESVQEYSIAGALVIDAAERQAGRPITLQADPDHGWIERQTLIALYGLAESTDAVYLFEHADGRSFDVVFAPGGQAITARAVARPELPEAHWPYVVTIRLIEV